MYFIHGEEVFLLYLFGRCSEFRIFLGGFSDSNNNYEFLQTLEAFFIFALRAD